MTNEENRCQHCRYWCTVDEGYSIWTVTETMVYCLKKHFEPQEESYSWELKDHEFLHKAIACVDFEKGDGIHLDVEYQEEDLKSFDEDLQDLYDKL